MKTPYLDGLYGLLAAKTIHRWMSTLDYRGYYYEPGIDPVEGVSVPHIYVFWHEQILFPLFLRQRCHLSMLLSQHRDADILAHIAFLLGFGTVRGSTYRGGATALLQLMRESERHHLTLTPDGPRGPRRQMAQGPLYLAWKLGLPLVPLGFGYDRAWRLNSWDRFAIPKPFARARFVAGPRITIPQSLTRQELEDYRLHIQQLLTQLADEAEDWAVSGRRREGETFLRQQPAPRPQRVLPTQEAVAKRIRQAA